MIKVWLNKQNEEKPSEEFSDALILNLLSNDKQSNIKTDIQNIWERFDQDNLRPINEDLLILSIAVMAIDKEVPRDYFEDRWTRDISVSIPVLEIDKFNESDNKFEKMLSFLTGDRWHIFFRKSEYKLRTKSPRKKKIDYIKNKNFNGVSLFSGGLDSFCGALKLLSQNNNILFTGFREYTTLGPRQYDLYNKIKNFYTENQTELMLIGIRFKRPIGESDDFAKLSKENTTRSRSFLFMSIALAIASLIDEKIPVYVPENGFIGINVPLTESRFGSCSTRTTHPYFINSFNYILQELGIQNKIINFYAHMSKGEIVSECKVNPIFKDNYQLTISCSHPCQARRDHKKIPMNCGYCYPCIIRKASLSYIDSDNDEYNYKLSEYLLNVKDKGSDLRAVLSSLKEYLSFKDDTDYLDTKLLNHGLLTFEEMKAYERVYIKTMEEIYSMILKQGENSGVLLDYLGLSKSDRGV